MDISTLTPTTLRTIDDLRPGVRIMVGLISRLETGRYKRRYSTSQVTKGDAGGLSVGWLQLARRTGTRLLEKACDLYLAQPNADEEFKSELRSMMPAIRDHDDPRPEKDPEYRQFFVELSEDPVWRSAQDELGLDELDRARKEWNDLQWETDLSLMTVYEGIILGGFKTCLGYTRTAIDRTRTESERTRVLTADKSDLSKADLRLRAVVEAFMDDDGDTLGDAPIDPTDEVQLLLAYIAVRHSWLENFKHEGHFIRKAVYRTITLRDLYDREVWDFEFGMTIKVFGREMTMTDDFLRYSAR